MFHKEPSFESAFLSDTSLLQLDLMKLGLAVIRSWDRRGQCIVVVETYLVEGRGVGRDNSVTGYWHGGRGTSLDYKDIVPN